MASPRSFNSTRITFFVFLDIITAVTGILLFVVLLLALRLDDGGSGTSEAAKPTGETGAGNSALEATLAELLRRLEALALSNRSLQAELVDADAAPDIAALRSEIAALQHAVAEEKAAGARLEAQSQDRAAADAARDNTLGLTADRAQIQAASNQLTALTAENDTKRQRSEALENEVKQAEARLLEAQARRGDSIWLVPDLPATSKEPILVIVSAQEAVAQRFNKPQSRVTIAQGDPSSAFRNLLGRCNKLDDYFVFYIRPSGLERFQQYVKEAREAGFEVGYDAIDEGSKVVFSKPPE